MRNKIIKIGLISLAIIGVTVGGLYFALYEGYLRLNYPSFAKYPVHGLDISHHQHEIDWSKLDRRYVQFVFIKATEGATHKDTRFDEYWKEAKKYNIPSGAYHFFTFCKGGREQAENFIATVPKEARSLPPAIDLEFDGNCQAANHKEDLLAEITEFIDIVEAHYEKKVLIYATSEFYKKYIANNLKNNPVWARDIYAEPKLENGRKWLFWQYANRGRLDGIDTFVDINVFTGSNEEFEKLIKDNP